MIGGTRAGSHDEIGGLSAMDGDFPDATAGCSRAIGKIVPGALNSAEMRSRQGERIKTFFRRRHQIFQALEPSSDSLSTD